MSDNEGILLIGHGTRDEQGTSEFFRLAELLQQRCQPVAVQPALLEFQSPTIQEGWASLMERGVRRVLVTPLLLFAAGHAKQDIPDALRQCRHESSSTQISQSRPLSRHRSIVTLASQRIGEQLGADDDLSRTAVVMVGRGSFDPCAGADMRLLSEIVRHKAGLPHVETAFYAMAEPKLPAVLEKVANSKRYDRVLVYPHLLFHGRLYQAILKQTRQAAEVFPNIQFQCTSYLGAGELVADAVADRAFGTVTGQPFTMDLDLNSEACEPTSAS